jgi:predicted RNase H-like HicB family nuclease
LSRFHFCWLREKLAGQGPGLYFCEVTRNFTVILEPEPDGGYHVFCPSLKGCHSQGETEAEAMDNIREAIELYLESLIAQLISLL